MDTIRLYLHSMRMLIRSQLEYPASFALQTLAQLVMEGGEMMAVILLVNRFEHLNRWEAGDLYFFFGLMSVTFYMTECFGRGITGNFPSLIRTGQLTGWRAYDSPQRFRDYGTQKGWERIRDLEQVVKECRDITYENDLPFGRL